MLIPTNIPRSLTVDFEYDWGGRVQSLKAVEQCLSPLLDLLDKHSVKATFFVSTETLPKANAFVKEIYMRGHEIASHGHRHAVNYDALSYEELKQELAQSKNMLEDLTGASVKGFRTPQLRRNQYTDMVAKELGYEYDSSMVSISLPGRYKKNQYQTSFQQFQVSNLSGLLPAGLKWLSLFPYVPMNGAKILVLYCHLFDFLSLPETVRSWNSELSWKHLVFYSARLKSFWTILEEFSSKSHPLSFFLENSV